MGSVRAVRGESSRSQGLFRMLHETDARHTLSVIRVPTLVVHREGDQVAHVEGGRYIAERIHGAKYVQLSGSDHFAWVGDTDAILDEVQEFLTGVRRGPEPERALATVMFTDIVGATQRAAELGDRRWRDLLDSHHAVVRRSEEHTSELQSRLQLGCPLLLGKKK